MLNLFCNEFNYPLLCFESTVDDMPSARGIQHHLELMSEGSMMGNHVYFIYVYVSITEEVENLCQMFGDWI